MKKSLIFGVLAAFAISAMSVQSLNAQNPVKTKTKTEKQVERKADKASTTSSASENTIKKQSKKDVKPAQSNTVSDCCKSSGDNTCKKKLSTTNASDQPNSAVKPKPETQSQTGTNQTGNDR